MSDAPPGWTGRIVTDSCEEDEHVLAAGRNESASQRMHITIAPQFRHRAVTTVPTDSFLNGKDGF